ncbi:hypothetical protein F5050DRAFT_1681244 [Lentinula boryana]|uniref:Protein kinase domain-containing protein n=1 Tax=Lentinula boryana TaxID=40481 RepID=A0ABQ8PYM8_9AGAR|nr:hypothetical protein F5050DRAFT_1681244 [Lentinula boryana]
MSKFSTQSVVAAFLVLFVTLASHAALKLYNYARLRRKLPDNFLRRMPNKPDDKYAEQQVWLDLGPFFFTLGYRSWVIPDSICLFSVVPDGILPAQSGYKFIIEGIRERGAGTLERYGFMPFKSSLLHFFLNRENQAVVIRPLTIGNEGKNQLQIIRHLSHPAKAAYTGNHILPMIHEIPLNDIIFGVFPLSGPSLVLLYSYIMPQNSVGDIVNMYLQALEALVFLHKNRIAHRDTFGDNFVIQWLPESLRAGQIPVLRPQVQLIDFEMAVQFPPDTSMEDCICYGLPQEGTSYSTLQYEQPFPFYHAQDTDSQYGVHPYNAFDLDVWQLCNSFAGLEVSPEVNAADLVQALEHLKPKRDGLTAEQAMNILRSALLSCSEQQLQVAPMLKPGKNVLVGSGTFE